MNELAIILAVYGFAQSFLLLLACVLFTRTLIRMQSAIFLLNMLSLTATAPAKRGRTKPTEQITSSPITETLSPSSDRATR